MENPGTITKVEVEITARPGPGMTLDQLRHHVKQLGMSVLSEHEDDDGPYIVMIRTEQEIT
jgi:hypothetical protein